MNMDSMNRRGFTLMEMLISLSIMLVVILALLTLVVNTQNVSLTEGRKLDMNQGARVLEQIFYDGFRSAGSVLSLANTPVLLGSTILPFNGVYPLNNVDYPDGVILAAGDPDGLTRLTNTFTPPGTGTISVQTVNLPDGSGVAWHKNDYGIIMRSTGYYVFLVTGTPALGATSLSIRNTSAYYSGLLHCTHFATYNDLCDEQLGSAGNSGSYTGGSPVVRLSYFQILLTRTEADGSRTLTLTTDCNGMPDGEIFDHPITDYRAVPILPNIEDIQIEYLTHDLPPQIWAGSVPAQANPCPAGSSNAAGCMAFISQFNTKNISSARVFVLLRTEEERNKKIGSGITYNKPVMGDNTISGNLPVGRYHYTYMQFEIMIRNYGNVY